MGANRTVSVDLSMRLAGYLTGLRTASRATGRFVSEATAAVNRHRSGLESLSRGTGTLGLAMVAAAGFAVKSFADFDKAMSSVKAATHASAEEMAILRQAAIDAGAKTSFSATEAASAIENLAKAGVSTTDILKGGLSGALDLAAAGQLDVGEAAEIAATAMTQFKLKGKDIPHLADLLAAGAGKAQGEVTDMGQALNQAGLVAGQFGISVEETTGTLAAFASAGLLGSDAGTSFKTMLLRLANPAAETAELMEELGISAYDVNGNFVGMAKFAEQLRTRLAGMTQQQRDATLAQIFGSDAIRAANVLYSQGAKGINEWTKKVNDSGYASETAAIQLDNLSGDIEQFKGSLDTALIGAGEGADGPLRKLTQGATKAVNAFNDLGPATKSALFSIVGGGGLALLGVAGLAKLVIGIADAKAAMDDLGITGGRVGKLLKFAGVVGAVVGVTLVIDELGKSLSSVNVDATKLRTSLAEWANEGKLTGEAARLLGGDLGELHEYFDALIDPNVLQYMANVAEKANPLQSSLDRASEGVSLLDQELTNLAQGGSAKEAAVAFEKIRKAAERHGVTTRQLKDLFPQYTEFLRTNGKANEKAAGSTKKATSATKDATKATAKHKEETSDAAKALEEMEKRAKDLEQAMTLLNSVLTNLDAESAYEASIDDAAKRLKEFRKEVKEGDESVKGMKSAFDLHSEAGRDNAKVLREIWERTSDFAVETVKLTGNQTTANGVLKAGRAQLVDMATKYLGSKKAAEKYVTEVLGIPKDVSTAVKQPGMPAAKANAKELRERIKRIPDKKTSKFVLYGSEYAITQATVLAARIASIDAYKAITIAYKVKGKPKADGGPIEVPGYANGGGPIRGLGTGRSDTAGLYALSQREWVMPARATDHYGPAFMDAIQNLRYDPMRYAPSRINSSGSGSGSPRGGEYHSHVHIEAQKANFDVRDLDDVLARRNLEERMLQGRAF